MCKIPFIYNYIMLLTVSLNIFKTKRAMLGRHEYEGRTESHEQQFFVK